MVDEGQKQLSNVSVLIRSAVGAALVTRTFNRFLQKFRNDPVNAIAVFDHGGYTIHPIPKRDIKT